MLQQRRLLRTWNFQGVPCEFIGNPCICRGSNPAGTKICHRSTLDFPPSPNCRRHIRQLLFSLSVVCRLSLSPPSTSLPLDLLLSNQYQVDSIAVGSNLSSSSSSSLPSLLLLRSLPASGAEIARANRTSERKREIEPEMCPPALLSSRRGVDLSWADDLEFALTI